MNFENFFIDGFLLDENPGIDFSFFKGMDFVDCNSQEGDIETAIPENTEQKYIDELKRLHVLFGEKYIGQLFSEYTLFDCGMWEGVDEFSAQWHNDWEDGDKFNSNMLVYLDDTHEHKNGIEIRGPNVYHQLYPNASQLIWLNQKKIFEHKATHNKGRRRVLSFEYMIPALV